MIKNTTLALAAFLLSTLATASAPTTAAIAKQPSTAPLNMGLLDRCARQPLCLAIEYDLRTLNPTAMAGWEIRLLAKSGLPQQEREAAEKGVRKWGADTEKWFAELRKRGGQRAYHQFFLSMMGSYRFFSVEPGRDPGELRQFLQDEEEHRLRSPDDPRKDAMIWDGFILQIDDVALRHLKQADRGKRSALIDAIKAVGDAPLSFAFNDDFAARAAIGELIGDKTRAEVLLSRMQWVAISFDTAPSPHARLIIKANDAKSAEEFRALWQEILKSLAEKSDFRGADINNAVAPLLPRAKGDELSLDMDERELEHSAWLIGAVWRAAQEQKHNGK